MAMIRRLHWKLVHRLRAWGIGNVLGISMLLLAASLHAYTYWQVEKPHAEAARQILQLQAASRADAAPGQDTANPLDLPTQQNALASLKRLQQLADENGLMIDRAHYRLEKDGQLSRYRLSLPIIGAYPDIRAFLSQAMQSFPHLAMESLRISREEPGMEEVDADMQLSFYFRP